MYDWILRITAAALVLSLLSFILPKSAIQKTALLGFGFIFLVVIISPIKVFVSGFADEIYKFRIRSSLDGIASASSLNEGDDAYIDAVIREYSDKIANEAERSIAEICGLKCEITAVVARDAEAENFAQIEHIYCVIDSSEQISEEADKEEKRLIRPVEAVDAIEISSEGISIKYPRDESLELTEEQEQGGRLTLILAEMFSLDESQCSVIIKE